MPDGGNEGARRERRVTVAISDASAEQIDAEFR